MTKSIPIIALNQKNLKKLEKCFSIFDFIQTELWLFIFETISFQREMKVKDKETLKSLRLVCKFFRNLLSRLWIQAIPSPHFSPYFHKINKFQLALHRIRILDLNYGFYNRKTALELMILTPEVLLQWSHK